jgi:hypothetical protein
MPSLRGILATPTIRPRGSSVGIRPTFFSNSAPHPSTDRASWALSSVLLNSALHLRDRRSLVGESTRMIACVRNRCRVIEELVRQRMWQRLAVSRPFSRSKAKLNALVPRPGFSTCARSAILGLTRGVELHHLVDALRGGTRRFPINCDRDVSPSWRRPWHCDCPCIIAFA